MGLKHLIKVGLVVPLALLSSGITHLQPESSAKASLSIAQTQGDAITQAERLLEAGDRHYQQDQFREAVVAYEKALALYRQKGGAPLEQLRRRAGEGTTLTVLGSTYARLGQYQKALDSLQQSLKIQAEVQERAAKGSSDFETTLLVRSRDRIRSAVYALGLVYNRLGQYSRARDYYQQAIAMSGRSPGAYPFDGELFNNLGRTYFNEQREQTALEFYYRTLVLLDQVGYPLGRDGRQPPNFIEANRVIYDPRPPQGRSVNEGLNQVLQPNYHNPVRMHPWARYLLVLTYNNIGDVYARRGPSSRAQQFYLQALSASRFVEDKELAAITLNNVGRGYGAAGDALEALKFHQQALGLSRELGDRSLEGQTLHWIGTMLLNQGRVAEASAQLNAAIKAWEFLRPGLTDADFVSLFETQLQTYDLLKQALVAQKQFEVALEISERGRARAFVELLSQRLGATGKPTTVPPVTIAQIRQIAQRQSATLVEYSVIGNDWIYIWVVQPSGTVAFRQVDLKAVLKSTGHLSLEKLVETTRTEGVGVRGRGTAANRRRTRGTDRPVTQDLKQLHSLLIEPISDLLPADPLARVVFVPQGSLFLVPFPSLQNARGQYLIERHTMLIAPSIQVLDLTHRLSKERSTANRQSSALIVGNPTMPEVAVEAGFPPEPLASLPGAEQEARTIASLLQTRPLTGNQATETAVVEQMRQARLVHLATHGFLDDFKGLGVPGAIALAPAGKADGLLTANEILDLELQADLVVLSACDTGRGKITGDGVIGLSRSFISAGAPSVVVSLWAVPDAPTATLMTEFYQNLQRTSDKAQSLRQAMLTTLNQYPDPQDWAAFVLIGQ